MATADYEKLLTDGGFQLVQQEPIQPKLRLYGPRSRRSIVTGQREVNGAVIEVQLQDVYTYNRRALAGVARVRRPGISGQGSLRPQMVYGAVASMMSAPWIALLFLVPFLLAGVWLVMLPGFLLMVLLTKALQRNDPAIERPELAAPSLGWRYSPWGADAEATRSALPISLQDALVATKWFGHCEVAGGAIVLDSPIGYGRTDLFAKLITAAQAAAQHTQG